MKNVMNRALVAEKKLVLIVAAVVMVAGALTLSSCNPVEPEKKGDFDVNVSNKGDFDVNVSNITQTTADYKIVPTDMEATFVIHIIHKDAASMTDEQIKADMKNGYDLLIKYDPKVTGYDCFLKSGTQEGTLKQLSQGSACTIIVVKMDAAGTFSGTLSRSVFKTLE